MRGLTTAWCCLFLAFAVFVHAESQEGVCINPEEHSTLRQQLETVRSQLQQVEVLKKDIDGVRKSEAAALKKVSSLEAEKAKLEAAVRDAKAAASNLASCQTSTSELKKKVEATETQRNDCRKKLDGLSVTSSDLSQCQKNAAAFESQAKDLKVQQEKHTKEHATLQMEHKKRGDAIDMFKKGQAALEAQIEEFKRKMSAAEATLAEANKNAQKITTDAEKAKSNLQKEIAQLKKRLNEIAKESWLFSYTQFVRSATDVWRFVSGVSRLAYNKAVDAIPSHCKETTVNYFNQGRALSSMYFKQADDVVAPYYRRLSTVGSTVGDVSSRVYKERISGVVDVAKSEGLKRASTVVDKATKIHKSYSEKINGLLDKYVLDPVFAADPSLKPLVPITPRDRVFFTGFVLIFTVVGLRIALAVLRVALLPLFFLAVRVATFPLRAMCSCFGKKPAAKKPRTSAKKVNKEGTLPVGSKTKVSAKTEKKSPAKESHQKSK